MAAGNATVTITGQTGPGLTATATVITDVAQVNFKFKSGTVEITKDGGPTAYFEYSNIATVTIVPATKAVTIST